MVLLTSLGLDGMGLDVMMSMVKLLLRYSQYHTKPLARCTYANHPRLIAKNCHSVHLHDH